jgi:hypothetical protein
MVFIAQIERENTSAHQTFHRTLKKCLILKKHPMHENKTENDDKYNRNEKNKLEEN